MTSSETETSTRSTAATNRKPTILKIMVLGECHVGKTALIERFVHHTFTADYKSTLGVDLFSKTQIVKIGDDEEEVRLQLWDTVGQERYRSIGSAVYRGADACCFVYDITRARTFDELDSWREEFLRTTNTPVPFVLLANMQDKLGPNPFRPISPDQARKWCDMHSECSSAYFETSAKEDVNVSEAFQFLCDAAFKSKREREEGAVREADLYTPINLRLAQDAEKFGKEDGRLCCNI